MAEETRQDLKIAGSTTVAGGTFNQVTVSGQAEINGDLNCADFRISGSSEVQGSLKTKTLRVSGHAAIGGNLRADEVRISGSFTGRGDLAARKINISGQADIAGNVTAESINISGYLATRGGREAESFVARGTVAINGMLNAGTIDIRHYGSRAGEIGGENINIRIQVPFGLQRLLKIFRQPGAFTAGTIEGDDIHLELVKAKVVRGNNITMGPDCEVDLVEYRDSFQKDKGAKAGETKRIAAK